jgi:hypothetical protein
MWNLKNNKSLLMGMLAILLLASCTGEREIKVMMLDMPVAKKSFDRSGIKHLTENFAPLLKMDEKVCSEQLSELETFFQVQLGKKQAPPLKHYGEFPKIVSQIHGYHIADLILKDVKNVEFISVGLYPAPTIKDFKQINKYILNTLMAEQKAITRQLSRHLPDIVNISASESKDENYQQLIEAGFKEKDARKNADMIYTFWKSFWVKTINQFQNTLFVVAAGNGGVDWYGDELKLRDNSDAQAIPANLGLKNMIVVTSTNRDGCLSSFANYSKEAVNVAMKGEEVSGLAPCKQKEKVQLTGTSQATARVTNFLLKKRITLKNISELSKHARRIKCLEGKLTVGYLY